MSDAGAVHDAAVIGGGLVGSAIAYGLAARLDSVAMLDEGDLAWRASRGNFGLVWVQSKGSGMAAYGRWTLGSAERWPRLHRELREATGIDVRLEQPGGLTPLLGDEEVAARVRFMEALMAQPGMTPYPWRLLSPAEVRDRVPGIGPEVRGAIWTPRDGHVNPLKLLQALHRAFLQAGGHYLPRRPARGLALRDGAFRIDAEGGAVRARRVVLAAGLGNAALAPQVGLSAPVRPQRGQILALERTRRHLTLPIVTLRQTDEGTWLIGDSQEEAGFDDTIGLPVLATLADRALRTLPLLRDVRVTRSWAALRVMSTDGFPVYDASVTHPGAFVATCHSGVTLAAAHAYELAAQVADGALPDTMAPFSARRFDVRTAA